MSQSAALNEFIQMAYQFMIAYLLEENRRGFPDDFDSFDELVQYYLENWFDDFHEHYTATKNYTLNNNDYDTLITWCQESAEKGVLCDDYPKTYTTDSNQEKLRRYALEAYNEKKFKIVIINFLREFMVSDTPINIMVMAG
jgi:hypothetical protein